MADNMLSLLKKDEIQWIGAIPVEWKSKRIKDVCDLSPKFSKGQPHESEMCTILPMESISEDGKYSSDIFMSFNDVQNGLTLIEEKDVLFAKITPCMENGKGCFVNNLKTKYAFGSTEFHVLRPNKHVNGKYLYYYTFNKIYRKYAEVNMTGSAGQKRVSSRFIKTTRIYLPDIWEQKLIAQYLDKATEAVDKTIALKKLQLQKFEDLKKSIIYKAVTKGIDASAKLKDSGIEWIGKIPEHWKVQRIKDILINLNFKRIPLSSEVRGQITEKIYDYYGASGVIDKVDDYLFDDTLILIAEDGANLYSRNTPLAFLAHGKFWVNNHAHILKPSNGDINYYVSLLESFDYSLHITGAAQPKLTSENLGKIKIPIPGINEQYEIAVFLQKQISDFEIVKNKLFQQIQKLEDYKKSLIHECVTGKRRITEKDLSN